jgi:hypothetical protein
LGVFVRKSGTIVVAAAAAMVIVTTSGCKSPLSSYCDRLTSTFCDRYSACPPNGTVLAGGCADFVKNYYCACAQRMIDAGMATFHQDKTSDCENTISATACSSFTTDIIFSPSCRAAIDITADACQGIDASMRDGAPAGSQCVDPINCSPSPGGSCRLCTPSAPDLGAYTCATSCSTAMNDCPGGQTCRPVSGLSSLLQAGTCPDGYCAP